LLRDEVKHNGPNAEKIESALKEGALVNPELVVELIKAAFEKNGMKGKYLLDGFPRSQDNLDAWKLIMKDYVDVPCILYFTCSEETLQKRLLKRGETSGRSDDNLESIKKRFNTFRTETEPIVEHFQKENKVESISAEHEIDEIYGNLKVAIASRRLDK
jgi:UMP-CMP kinase